MAPITATFITLSNNVHEYAAGGLPGSGTGALDDQPGRVVFRCKDSAIIRTAQVIEWILRPNSLQGGTGFPDTAPGYSAEFAAFLKETLGYVPGDGTLPW